MHCQITEHQLDENHEPLPLGGGQGSADNPGELFVKTPHLMLGYSGTNASDNQNIQSDGFYTGDLAYIENDEIYIVGRKKDLIIRGGLNIAPSTVEAVLMDVLGAAEISVVGIPDNVYGEEVAAGIVLPDRDEEMSVSDLRTLIGERLAPFQKPKHIHFFDKLPRGLTGKIDKLAIKTIIENTIAD